MTFFCVIVALLVNYFWQREDARSMDRQVLKWQSWVLERVGQKSDQLSVLLTIMICAGFPALVLISALLLLDGIAFGVLTLLLHIFVLVLALSGEDVRGILLGSMQYCRTGAVAAARRYAHKCLERLSVRPAESTEGAEGAEGEDWARLLVKAALGQVLRRLYVVVFWYLIAGPVAVVVYAQCLFLWQGQAAGAAGVDLEWADMLRNTAERIIAIIEWLPIRLLMVFFALAGHFSEAWSEMADEQFWTLDVRQGELLLYRVAVAATGVSKDKSRDNDDTDCPELLSAVADLLHRTQFVGIAIVALYILVV